MATYGCAIYDRSNYGPDDTDSPDAFEVDANEGIPNHKRPYTPSRVGAASGGLNCGTPGSPPVPTPGGATGPYPGALVTIPVVNTAFILPSLGSIAVDYAHISVQWQNLPGPTLATVTDFRVLSNPWGFPVDENDGTIVYEVKGTPAIPGTNFTDASVTPGDVMYYGFYVNNGTNWFRAGFTACMMPAFHGYGDRLFSDLPPFLQNQKSDITSLDVSVAAPNVPASGGTVVNPYSFDLDVWLSESANVMADGIPMGQVTRFPLQANGTLKISYTGTLFWQWVARAVQPQNTALTDFTNVLGFGLDTIKTQYDHKLRTLNDPMRMSLGDLVNLCGQLGLPYNSEIPAYAMRKAALNWGRTMKERGTLAGIALNITLLTNFPADVQVSRNMLLDDDQSAPLSPQFPGWSANVAYQIGEIVQYPVAQPWSVVSSYPIGAVVVYNDLLYTATVASSGIVPTNTGFWSNSVNGPFDYVCIAATTPGTAPSGTLTANWALLYGGIYNTSHAYNSTFNIPGLSGNAGTWEYLQNSGSQLTLNIGAGFPTPQTWPEGSSTPTTGPNSIGNTFRAVNSTAGTLTNTWIRSLCRSSADIAGSKIVPDPQLVVEHGIPVPTTNGTWVPTRTYHTNDLVNIGNINYIALRQSKGATPPMPGIILNQNYDFESGISPWTGANATVTQSNLHAYNGFFSMQMVSSGSNAHAASENVPCIPGATYMATALVFSTSAATGVHLAANWNDWTGGYISGVFPGGVTLTPNTWTEVSCLFTVPTNANTLWLAPSQDTGFTTFWDVVQVSCVSTPEWGPLGYDTRFPITMSAYGVADLGTTPTTSATLTPFVEWYDNWGNLITRVFARSSSTSGGYPANYQFDSFDTGAGMPVAGRLPINPSSVWSVPVGAWTIGTAGAAFAGETENDAIAVLPSTAAGILAATVAVPAGTGFDCGPLFWYQNTSNFWVAGLDNLYYVSAGTTHTPIAYSTTCAAWDRIYVQANNTTSTTTLPNGHTVIGPSVVVYRNSMTTANILLVVGSGGTQTQTAMSSLTSPYLPSTSATSSFAGIGSITI